LNPCLVGNGKKVQWQQYISLSSVRKYRIVYKSYIINLSIQGYSILKMAGKRESVMGAVKLEETKTKSRSLTEHWINLKK